MSDLPPHPSVSTGNTGEAKVRAFLESVREGVRSGEIMKDYFNVGIVWKGKSLRETLGPDDFASFTPRIEQGKLREFSAAYLALRDKSRSCAAAIRGMCLMGGQPFARLSGASFDHIDGNRMNHRLSNLRLVCPPCNSHLQWKQKLGAGGKQVRERAEGIDIDDEPAEIRINRDNRPGYKVLLDDYLKQHHEIGVYDAIHYFARKLQEKNGHGSPQACRNYLKTLTAGEDSEYEIAENKVRMKE